MTATALDLLRAFANMFVMTSARFYDEDKGDIDNIEKVKVVAAVVIIATSVLIKTQNDDFVCYPRCFRHLTSRVHEAGRVYMWKVTISPVPDPDIVFYGEFRGDLSKIESSSHL
jgi:hypothetical protein